MGVISETTASITRFRAYGNRLGDILSKYQIHTPADIRRQAEDPHFRTELVRLWCDILNAEGGKLTLTVVLGTIGIALGGVGIAAAGSAIGMPLVMVLAPVGFFAGQELDAERYFAVIWEEIRRSQRLGRLLDKAKNVKELKRLFPRVTHHDDR
jgi:hypothetical protein